MSDDVALMSLDEMRFFGRIGHTEEERSVGTHVEVDVDLAIPLEEGPSHSLARTIDYREVHGRIDDVVSEGEHPLLEGLAEEILDALEGLGWQRCVVRVRKRSPPIDGTMGSAQIQLERDRSG
jgi:dihydroneopterin aldolase